MRGRGGRATARGAAARRAHSEDSTLLTTASLQNFKVKTKQVLKTEFIYLSRNHI